MSDAQINRSRRQLSTLISRSYSHISLAATLLKRKAAPAPDSVEGDAYRMLVTARQEIDQWLSEAGKLVDVEFRK